MSMEFLMGRSLLNALYNLNIKSQYKEAIQELGYKLEDLVRAVLCCACCVVLCCAEHACGAPRHALPAHLYWRVVRGRRCPCN